MIDSPQGYTPFEKTEFPPKLVDYLAHGVALVLSVLVIILYPAESTISFLIALGFGIVGNIYLHESIHYLSNAWMGYEPVFSWPNAVWVPNEALPVRDGVIALLSPQLLTLVYPILIAASGIQVIDFMLAIALVLNVAGGFRDFAWTIRRLTWPREHLALVNSAGEEFIAFRE